MKDNQIAQMIDAVMSATGSGVKQDRYRVIHKKVSHETKEKMQEKMKMILQRDEILVPIH